MLKEYKSVKLSIDIYIKRKTNQMIDSMKQRISAQTADTPMNDVQ